MQTKVKSLILETLDKNKTMDAEKLLELMHDYLNQYGLMSEFLEYCAEDCDLDEDEVEEAIEEHFYGG